MSSQYSYTLISRTGSGPFLPLLLGVLSGFSAQLESLGPPAPFVWRARVFILAPATTGRGAVTAYAPARLARNPAAGFFLDAAAVAFTAFRLNRPPPADSGP